MAYVSPQIQKYMLYESNFALLILLILKDLLFLVPIFYKQEATI